MNEEISIRKQISELWALQEILVVEQDIRGKKKKKEDKEDIFRGKRKQGTKVCQCFYSLTEKKYLS